MEARPATAPKDGDAERRVPAPTPVIVDQSTPGACPSPPAWSQAISVPLPSFNGEGQDPRRDLQGWRQRLKAYLIAREVPGHKHSAVALLATNGAAAVALAEADVTPETRLGDLFRVLEDRFGRTDPAAVQVARLQMARRAQHETVIAFNRRWAAATKRLRAAEAQQELHDGAHSGRQQQFPDYLLLEYYKAAVGFPVALVQAYTLQDAMRLAERVYGHEQLTKINATGHGGTGGRRRTTSLAPLTASTPERRTGSPGKHGRTKCFYCKSGQHVLADCPDAPPCPTCGLKHGRRCHVAEWRAAQAKPVASATEIKPTDFDYSSALMTRATVLSADDGAPAGARQGQRRASVLLDTGAAVNVVSTSLATALGLQITASGGHGVLVSLADGTRVHLSRTANVHLSLGEPAASVNITCRCFVLDGLAASEVILGYPMLARMRLRLTRRGAVVCDRESGRDIRLTLTGATGHGAAVAKVGTQPVTSIVHDGVRRLEDLLRSARAATAGETGPTQDSNRLDRMAWPGCQPAAQNSGHKVGGSPATRRRVRQVLSRYRELFRNRPGAARVTPIRIATGGASPAAQRPFRHPADLERRIQAEVDSMLAKGVVTPSRSPYAAPVFLVAKKSGEWRFVVDYRRLNKDIVGDAYPSPLVSTVVQRMRGCRWVSLLDMRSGYWQVPVSPEDRHKTAFATQRGLYEFTVMPFGLKTAPAHFQRVMDGLLRDVPGVGIYLDDLVIASKSFEEHLRALEEVLRRLSRVGMRLNPGKCSFVDPDPTVLGQSVSAEGTRPERSKVAAVRSMPRPKTKAQLRSWYGLATYFASYIPRLATCTKTLRRLLRKGVRFEWSPGCEREFRTVNAYLATRPMLHHPDLTETFEIHVDASQAGLGATLMQKDRVVEYYSKAFTESQKRWSSYDREAFAAISALEKWRHYYWGRRVRLVCDPTALVAVFSTGGKHTSNGRAARWLHRIADYDVEVQHRPGRSHGDADGLSRLPLPLCPTSRSPNSAASSAAGAPTRPRSTAPNASNTGSGVQSSGPDRSRPGPRGRRTGRTRRPTRRLLEWRARAAPDPDGRPCPAVATAGDSTIRRSYRRSGREVWEVQAIRGVRLDSDGQFEFNVGWRGYSRATWEPEESLSHCPQLLEQYKRSEEFGHVRREQRKAFAARRRAEAAALRTRTRRNTGPRERVQGQSTSRATGPGDTDVDHGSGVAEAENDVLVSASGQPPHQDLTSFVSRGSQGRDEQLAAVRDILSEGRTYDSVRTRQVGEYHRWLVSGWLELDSRGVVRVRVQRSPRPRAAESRQTGPMMQARVRTIVPRQQRKAVLQAAHDTPLGHHGGTRSTLSKLLRYVEWPSIRRDVQLHVAACLACARRKPGQTMRRAWSPIVAHAPLEAVSLDIVGPLPATERENRFILTIIDRFSRLAVAVPLADTSAEQVARAFLERWVMVFGVPRWTLSDRGPQFRSALMEQVCLSLGIDVRHSSPYFPQGNGQVERFHRRLNESLSAFVSSSAHNDWDLWVATVVCGLNAADSRSTGMSPWRLVFGRTPHLPPLPPQTDWVETVHSENPRTFGRRLAREVRRLTHQARQRQLDYASTYGGRTGATRGLPVDSLVMRRVPPGQGGPATAAKFLPRFDGPWRVLATSGRTARLQHVVDGRSTTANLRHLKRFRGRVGVTAIRSM